METRISAILAGRVAPFGPEGEPSGYRKARRDGKVQVTPIALAGDEQADRVHHGGPDKAIHHYPFDHYARWAADRPALAPALQAPGAFGENISTTGWTEADICIGDQFRMGSAIIEVSQGRQPCWKLGHSFGDSAMVAQVVKTGRCGWYYRVIAPGAVEPGDSLQLLDRPHPDWSVARVFRVLIRRKTAPGEITDLARVAQLSESWQRRCRAALSS